MKSLPNYTISIDGRSLMYPLSGSATYLICALNELSAQQPNWIFYVLTNRPLRSECKELIDKRPNIHFLCKSFTSVALLWYCTQLYFILKKLKPDYFWAPATLLPPFIPAGVKPIVTVNDLVPKDYKHTMSFFNRLYCGFLFDRSIMHADVLLAISDYTANEVKRRYPGRRSKEIAVGCGVDRSVFKPMHLSSFDRATIAQQYGTTEPFLLFVGTLEPRKNLDFMLQLMPYLAADGMRLLVVGAKGWGESRVADIVQKADYPSHIVTFAGYVPTSDLVKLYNTAAMYISTAMNEGFGLPQLEAMNCGCPVVSPHNSAMIEVVEGAGITVKGWDIIAWCNTIRKVYNNRDQYIRSGFMRAEAYSWPQIASEIAKRISNA